ncbi:MAG: dienelactone hydrolase family protein [Candidatus Binataceae bacterium]
MAFCLVALSAGLARADWTRGEFTANGKPVTEYHCVPAGKAPHPAIILLHGAGPQGSSDASMEKMCGQLAAAGYYAVYLEYYSQTDDVTAFEPAKMKQYFPIWLGEIRAGIDAMDQNPQIDPKRIGLMGFSLGSFLSLSTGATDPGKIAAIVEYYGGLPSALDAMVANLPPTLIIHGDADQLVPVAQAHALDTLMTDAKRPHEIHIYPGANHAFNFQIPVWYNAADAQDAWQRSLSFLAQYLVVQEAAK